MGQTCGPHVLFPIPMGQKWGEREANVGNFPSDIFPTKMSTHVDQITNSTTFSMSMNTKNIQYTTKIIILHNETDSNQILHVTFERICIFRILLL